MSKLITITPLAIEAAILAAVVAGVAAMQEPDVSGRRDLLATPSPITEGWIERNPLLFGGAVGIGVMMLVLLLLVIPRVWSSR